jgi:hypothetical protein
MHLRTTTDLFRRQELRLLEQPDAMQYHRVDMFRVKYGAHDVEAYYPSRMSRWRSPWPERLSALGRM